MALDHFVSRVHLKQFIDPSLGHLLNAIRKSNLRQFTPTPHDVCRIEDGNTNPFLTEPRIVEDILRHIEPAYDRCLADLRQKKMNQEIREVFSGFLTFIITCTPAGVRLLEPPTQFALQERLKWLEERGDIPPFPISGRPEYDGKTATELLETELLRFHIDLKMPQAMLITKWNNLKNILKNSDWDILLTSDRDSFLTSDFPAAALEVNNYGSVRFFPLAPDIGIVVHTDKRRSAPSRFVRSEFFEISKNKIVEVNRHIVRAAESLVFSNHKQDWLLPFVQKNQQYCLEVVLPDMQLREVIKASRNEP